MIPGEGFRGLGFRVHGFNVQILGCTGVEFRFQGAGLGLRVQG
jgi:hypothetical protein